MASATSTTADDNTEDLSIPSKSFKPSFRRSREISLLRQSFVPYDISYHPGCQICFFAPPRQRQRWGDNQILPRVNWGDLFFDLFYVAAAYNTSNILVFSPNNQGLLYFLGTFLPVMGLWTDKLYYDGRYSVGDDVFHRVFELATLSVLATTVVFIRPVDVLSHASEYVDMFGFAVAIFCGRLLTVARYAEVYFFGEGQPVIQVSSTQEMMGFLVSLLFYGAAAIVAGVAFYGHAEPNATINHVPIILILVGILAGRLYFNIKVMFFFPTGGRHKEISIPLNIDFIIHRHGEWVMLMLGESVLSLLTVGVEQEGSSYLLTFYAAMLSVILLQYLHFRSQPTHADQHAMRRHKNAGIGYAFFSEVYSASLIALGSAYTLLVAAFNQTSGASGHRLLNDAANVERRLTSEVLPSMADPHVRQRVDNIFCGSLVLIMICLDAKFILHLGWKDISSRCDFGSSHNANVKGIILLFSKFALLAFIGSLSQYETKPEQLVLIGLGCICVKLIMRGLAGHYFPSADHHHHHDAHGSHDAHGNNSDHLHQAPHDSATAKDEADNDKEEGDDNDDDEDDDEGESGNQGDEDDLEEGEAKWPNVTHARAQPVHEIEG